MRVCVWLFSSASNTPLLSSSPSSHDHVHNLRQSRGADHYSCLTRCAGCDDEGGRTWALLINFLCCSSDANSVCRFVHSPFTILPYMHVHCTLYVYDCLSHADAIVIAVVDVSMNSMRYLQSNLDSMRHPKIHAWTVLHCPFRPILTNTMKALKSKILISVRYYSEMVRRQFFGEFAVSRFYCNLMGRK